MSSTNIVIDFISPELLSSHMQGFGYETRISKMENGSPTIYSSMGELKFVVVLMKASDEPGYSVASMVCLFSNRRLPLGFANRWNRERYFGKAVIDDDGDPVLEMNIVVRGVTELYLRRCFAIWQNAVVLFIDELARIQDNVNYSDLGNGNSVVPLANKGKMQSQGSVRSMSDGVTSSDVSEIKRLLSAIGSGVQSMSGESGSNLKAVVNRLETVNGRLGEMSSFLREISSNTRR